MIHPVYALGTRDRVSTHEPTSSPADLGLRPLARRVK